MIPQQREFSRAPQPGTRICPDGTEFCVYAGHATGVELIIFSAEGAQTSYYCTDVGGGYWAAHVPDVGAGTRYGYRVFGPWKPREGYRYNPAKLLTDPYARAIEGAVTWRPEVFGHTVGADFTGDSDVADPRDSADFVPRGVVVSDEFDWGEDHSPEIATADSVIYEMHVRGFTKNMPDVPEPLRGTYAGLAHPAAIAHLLQLGVTSVELLPVHFFVDEPHLVKLGLTNYWGYNTLGFFAPHADYAAATTAQGVVDEFKSMVKALHAAGIEVLLDVVYNHTCEQGGHEGATLSLRGFDNRVYYRLDEAGRDVDVTGCGNSVDVRHPAAMQLILDSLRYWVSQMHVDGFRFDLAVTLARGPGDEFNPNDALLMAMRTDPVLSRVKLIAEPWDVGMHGWRTGQFPPPLSEWNDRFRNTVRDFWLTDVARDQAGQGGHGIADLATRVAGSRDIFASPFRRPQAGVNFVTAHDGFPMADLTAYNDKHNEANGEQGRDGTTDNRSWNHGVEGVTDEPGILEVRYRTQRNLLATLLMSSGVPMLTAGDEFARTQSGNNNAYCQDSPVSWVDWRHDHDQRSLTETVRFLIGLRQSHPVLRRTSFFPGQLEANDHVELRWFDTAGDVPTAAVWQASDTRVVQAYFDGAAEGLESLLLVFFGQGQDGAITLPGAHGVREWDLLWDSRYAQPKHVESRAYSPASSYPMVASSMAIFRAVH